MTSQPTTNPFRHPALLFTAATAASSVIATSMVLWLAPTPEPAVCPEAAPVVVADAAPTAPTAPTAKPSARPETAAFDAGPGLDKSVIRKIVRAHINEVRHCYNEALASQPDTSGRVSVQFTIGTEGIVTASDVAQNTTGDDDLGECVRKAAKRWHYPAPKNGESVVVTYPFVLAPG